MVLPGIAWYGVVLWCDVLLTAQVPLALQATAAVTGDGAGTPRVDFCHNKQDRGKRETSETSQQTGQGKRETSETSQQTGQGKEGNI